jgi:hypothetical protein
MVLNGDQLEVYDLNNGNTVMTLQFVPDRPKVGGRHGLSAALADNSDAFFASGWPTDMSVVLTEAAPLAMWSQKRRHTRV